MDGFDSAVKSIPWPNRREIKDDGWRPPAGTRVISVDDHGMEEMHLWENRLKGADRDRAPKLWRGEDNRFHMEVDGMSYDVPGLESEIGEGCEHGGGRPGSGAFCKPSGGPGAMNSAGQDALDDILTNPNSTSLPSSSGRFPGGTDIKIPNGPGARFDNGGTFKGFLEP